MRMVVVGTGWDGITPDIHHSVAHYFCFALLCSRDRVRANDCATPTGEVGEVGEGVACSHDGCMVHNWAAGEEVMAKAKVVRGGNLSMAGSRGSSLVCLAYQRMRARAPNKDGVSST